ncbi:MAG: hypothetical protein HY903_13345 [Deltaproteobacteria bacterium]|nr:hypothetical protein [Deltaproteobacteria bacterium]
MAKSLCLVATLGGLLLSVALSAYRLRHQVAQVDLDAVSALIRAQFAPGDLVVVEPSTLSGPRERLGDLPLVEPYSLEAADLDGVRRVHLIHLDVLGVRTDFAEILARVAEREAFATFGRVQVTRFRLRHPTRTLFDLRAQLGEARVRARYADGVTAPCDRFERDRYLCPRDPAWNYVGRDTLAIDHQPRDCVWMHPVANGGRLEIELPPMTAPGSMTIAAAFGFAAEAIGRVRRPVHIELQRDADVLLALDHEPREGFERVRVPLAASPAPLTLVLSTSDNGAAHLCGSIRIVEDAS